MKKLIVLFSCLLFSFTLFSVQDSTLDVVKANEDNLFFQSIGKGKNNLIFIFDNLIKTKEQLENNDLNIKNKIETFSQAAEVFAVFLFHSETVKYWQRCFPENYQQSFFYITQKVNCTGASDSNKLTESVIDFFQQNHSSFNEQTIVFLVRDDIENIIREIILLLFKIVFHNLKKSELQIFTRKYKLTGLYHCGLKNSIDFRL